MKKRETIIQIEGFLLYLNQLFSSVLALKLKMNSFFDQKLVKEIHNTRYSMLDYNTTYKEFL